MTTAKIQELLEQIRVHSEAIQNIQRSLCQLLMDPRATIPESVKMTVVQVEGQRVPAVILGGKTYTETK